MQYHFRNMARNSGKTSDTPKSGSKNKNKIDTEQNTFKLEDKIKLGKEAQLKSQLAAKERAEKRKEATYKRAKRTRNEETSGDEPSAKKKKTEGRVIDFTDRDLAHIQHLFNISLQHFGAVRVMGISCGYDAMFCPILVYPIFTAPPPPKPKSPLKGKYILGVGRISDVGTGIKQAFTELYPQYSADRVYDWKLWKWNKKVYKAVTMNVSVDPNVLAQSIYSSKSFGGTKHLPAVKITDDLQSNRKLECAVEVAKYIETLPDSVKESFPPGYRTISFDDIREILKEVEMAEANEKETEKEVSEKVASSDLVNDRFNEIQRKKEQPRDEDDSEESEDEDGECSE